MQSVYESFASLPDSIKLTLVAMLVKVVTSGIKKNTQVSAWLGSMDVKVEKVAKQVIVVLIAGIVATANCAFFDAEYSKLAGSIVTYAASAVALHEGWDKLVLSWFKKDK